MDDTKLVKSATRIFDILELFEYDRRPMRVGEIAERIEIPQSSASMLLKTMVMRGYAEYDARRHTYCPSVRVAFLCDWAARKEGVRTSAHEVLRKLARETGETVLLARQNGIRLQYLSVLDAQQTLRQSVASGMVRPMHMTAIGIMLMSRMEDSQITPLLRHYNAEREIHEPPARVGQVIRAIERARKQGYYESASLATPGAGVIATVMMTPIRDKLLGIGIGGPVARLHEHREKLVTAVIDIAREF
ncbi:IclR family transcriptional regulator [Paraburkholderia unamae]|uniref:IclR family transcriptional regulator n=1 Tax=Paraburkholderia unamae TaxID=219649 RepID=UPI000DC5511C|nr:IclR family transcriptional regulator [Paraburkholderia unamae]RAR54572.1 IclR family transcriptional regulator [Paraburkholderia unamae]